MYLHEAMNRPDSNEFKMAMQKELGDQTIKYVIIKMRATDIIGK